MAMTMPAMIVVKMTTGVDARDWKKGIFPVRRKWIMKILYRMNSQKYFLFGFMDQPYLRQSTFRKPISLSKWNKGRVHCSNLVQIPIRKSLVSRHRINKDIGDRTNL